MTREEAVKWLAALKDNIGKTQHRDLWDYEQALDEIIQTLEQESKRGKWVELGQNKDGTHNICCGVCGVGKFKSRGHARSYNTRQKFKYCPNCGARMESEGE